MVAVRAVGTVASGTAAVTPGLPAGTVAGDLLLLFVETGNETVPAMTGWMDVSGSPVAMATAQATRLTVRWKRAGAGETAPAVPDPGDHVVARIIGVDRGADMTSAPIHASAAATEATSDTSVAFPAVTTALPGCLILNAIAVGTDVASTTQFSGWTNAALSGLTERIDNVVTAGNGGGLGVVTGTLAVPGSAGSTTATVAAAATKAMLTIAIAPPTFDQLVDDFEDGVTDFTKWPNSYGSYSESDGKLVLACDTGYNAYSSDTIYALNANPVVLRGVEPPAAASGTGVYMGYWICSNDVPAGTDVGVVVQADLGQIWFQNRVGYWDDTPVMVTYDPGVHVDWDMRLVGSDLVYRTSPDGVTWTVQRTITAPSWLPATAAGYLKIESHRESGTANSGRASGVNTLAAATEVHTTTGTAAASATATSSTTSVRTRSGAVPATATASSTVTSTRSHVASATAAATARSTSTSSRAVARSAPVTATARSTVISTRIRTGAAAASATARATTVKRAARAGTAAASATAAASTTSTRARAGAAPAIAVATAQRSGRHVSDGVAMAAAGAYATTGGSEQHPTAGTAVASATARATATSTRNTTRSAAASATARVAVAGTHRTTGAAAATAHAYASTEAGEVHVTIGSAGALAGARETHSSRRIVAAAGRASAIARAITTATERHVTTGSARAAARAVVLSSTRRQTSGRAAARAGAFALPKGTSTAPRLTTRSRPDPQTSVTRWRPLTSVTQPTRL